MNIELSLDGKVAKMKIDGILNSENAYLLQEKLTEVLIPMPIFWNLICWIAGI
ncbi:MAG TPA: hypothetical protein PKX24_03670 [Candidatus Cloacimonas acidaminovorans]|nr:hypothetical protein [Candidatus Cloacimonas acidaminovorans]